MSRHRWTAGDIEDWRQRQGDGAELPPEAQAFIAGMDALKRSKYGVDLSPAGKAARTRGAITFGSLLEAERYDELMALRAEGKVLSFNLQPSWVLTEGTADAPAVRFRADFLAVWAYGVWPTWRGLEIPREALMTRDEFAVTVDEVKGTRTAAYLRNLRQMAVVWPGVVICELTREGARRAEP